MEKPSVYAELVEFAEKRLNATAYPDCSHRFSLYECEKCGGLSFAITIERHERDTPGDFHGILRTRCANCGHEVERLGVVSSKDPQKPIATEHPRCACGHDTFHAGMCERWEDWGFFDEGTVVAKCTACGALRELVDTD
jgi:hypothetical protein